jgi:putative IMPACT (imprinted ancient) family translation regulator
LRGSGLGDVVVVVTRYFGGTKLGIGGLVRAYTQAAQEVVARVPRARKVLTHTVMLGLPYSQLEGVRRLVVRHGGTVLDEVFAAEITLTLRFPTEAFPAFRVALRDLSAGQLDPLVLETGMVRLPPTDLSACDAVHAS